MVFVKVVEVAPNVFELIFLSILAKYEPRNAVIDESAIWIYIAIGLLVLKDSLGFSLDKIRLQGFSWQRCSKSRRGLSRAGHEGRRSTR